MNTLEFLKILQFIKLACIIIKTVKQYLLGIKNKETIQQFQMQQLQKIITSLQLDKLDTHPWLKSVQPKTKLKPSLLAVISAAVLLLISLVVDISPLVAGIACVLVPGYLTLETIGTKVQRKYIKYLVYWVMFGLTEVAIQPVIIMIFGSLFAMVYQVAMCVMLLHPKFNLSLIIYDRLIRIYILGQPGQVLQTKPEQAKLESAPVTKNTTQPLNKTPFLVERSLPSQNSTNNESFSTYTQQPSSSISGHQKSQ